MRARPPVAPSSRSTPAGRRCPSVFRSPSRRPRRCRSRQEAGRDANRTIGFEASFRIWKSPLFSEKDHSRDSDAGESMCGTRFRLWTCVEKTRSSQIRRQEFPMERQKKGRPRGRPLSRRLVQRISCTCRPGGRRRTSRSGRCSRRCPMSKRSRILSLAVAMPVRLMIDRPQVPSTAPPSVPVNAR